MLLALAISLGMCETVKMTTSQTLRALVNKRLTAAAEDILELFERTIAEYEEEVSRLKQTYSCPQALDEMERPITAGVQTVSVSEDHSQVPFHFKEEPELCIKQEEEQLQEFPFTPVCVKSDDDEDVSCVLHQGPTEESREETNVEDSDTHLQSHSEEGHVIGGNCGGIRHTTDNTEDFSQEQITSEILKTDLVSKPHTCYECGKGFRRKAHLNKHVLIHTGQKPFKCPFCEKSFTVFYTLKRHIRTHTGEKPYSCSVCQKCFRDKTGLDYHIKTHTGEKPFSCSVCNKSFARNTCLKAHMRLHTGERPYSCPVCKKSYPQNKTLRAHLATHTRPNQDRNQFSDVQMEEHADFTQDYSRTTDLRGPTTGPLDIQ